MLFSLESVQTEALNARGERSENEYLDLMAKNISRDLGHERDYWRNYGPYWWNLADVLRGYAPKEWRLFMSYAEDGADGNDEEVKSLYDYGSEILNIVVAQMYLLRRAANFELGGRNVHYVESMKDDEGHPYRPGLGYLDGEEFED